MKIDWERKRHHSGCVYWIHKSTNVISWTKPYIVSENSEVKKKQT